MRLLRILTLTYLTHLSGIDGCVENQERLWWMSGEEGQVWCDDYRLLCSNCVKFRFHYGIMKTSNVNVAGDLQPNSTYFFQSFRCFCSVNLRRIFRYFSSVLSYGIYPLLNLSHPFVSSLSSWSQVPWFLAQISIGAVSSAFKAILHFTSPHPRVNNTADSTAQIPDACYSIHNNFASTTQTQR